MFEIDSSVVDANELLKRVRENVLHIESKAPYLAGQSIDILCKNPDALSRIESDLASMLENIQMMNRTWYHQDAQIQCRFRFLRPLVILFKRAIRKAIYWFTQPYVEQQNAFNGAITRAVSDSLRAQQALLETIQKQ